MAPRAPPAKQTVQPEKNLTFDNQPRKHPSVLKKLKLAKATANISELVETKKQVSFRDVKPDEVVKESE